MGDIFHGGIFLGGGGYFSGYFLMIFSGGYFPGGRAIARGRVKCLDPCFNYAMCSW